MKNVDPLGLSPSSASISQSCASFSLSAPPFLSLYLSCAIFSRRQSCSLCRLASILSTPAPLSPPSRLLRYAPSLFSLSLSGVESFNPWFSVVRRMRLGQLFHLCDKIQIWTLSCACLKFRGYCEELLKFRGYQIWIYSSCLPFCHSTCMNQTYSLRPNNFNFDLIDWVNHLEEYRRITDAVGSFVGLS